MKTKFIILVTLLYCLSSVAQHSISGNFAPAKDFKWVLVYQLTPGSQRYVADTAVTEGYFRLELPANISSGMYRLVYAVPQDSFYIDIIYNGQEDVEFNFNLEDGVSFVTSGENTTYSNYLSEITLLEQQLADFYESGNTSKKEYREITKSLSEVQTKFEAKGTNTLVYQFIKANTPYIPDSYEDFDAFFSNKKKVYFDHLDFSSRFLQSSGILKVALSNYVFSALPLDVKTKEAMQSAILENVAEVSEILKDTPIPFKIVVFQALWKTANTSVLHLVSDSIFSTYLKDLADQIGDQDLIDEIELSSRLRIGTRSPEITWIKDNKTKILSGLEGAEHYVLVFWSSTCSHCLKELPVLHKELLNYKNVRVVAIGLEDNDTFWKREIGNLPDFEHAIALGKWESNYAQLFGIKQTPTYFILDKDKRFVASPKDDKEVVSFLNQEY
jgi:thiol-disulfide isomerase/thioredoxin